MTQNNHQQQTIPPELVREVTDKVYALWRKDLQIANERKRLHGRTQRKR